MIITKEFTFDAAHKLINYEGKCKELHGHTYRLRVAVKGEVDEKSGIVMDFDDLRKIVEQKVLNKLDHTYLNDIIKQPTSENIAVWIWDQLKADLDLHEIKLWETPTSFVAYRGG